MAPWVKGLLPKDKDPSLDPSVHIGPRCKGVFLQCKCWGHKDRWIPGTGWQVRLKNRSSRFSGRTKVESDSGRPWALTSDLHMCTHGQAHPNTYAYMRAYTHIHTKGKRRTQLNANFPFLCFMSHLDVNGLPLPQKESPPIVPSTL